MKKRYVYYDKETGQIRDILSNRKAGRSPFIECSNEDVSGFISGEWGINQWVVAYDKNLEKNILIKKNNVIRLREPQKKLYKIPYGKNTKSDLKLIYYSDRVLEVLLDVSRIAPLYQTNFKDDVRFEKGTELRIIAKTKKSKELIKEIIIDAQELLESAQLFFRVSGFQNDIEFFTYKLLNSYSWYKGTVKLISPMTDRIKFDIHKADLNKRSENFSYHLIMKPYLDGIKIENNIEDPDMVRINKFVEFFVVDKYDPNVLYRKFIISEDELSEKEIIVDLKINMKGKTLLYNHKYISVLLEQT